VINQTKMKITREGSKPPENDGVVCDLMKIRWKNKIHSI